MRRTTIPNYKLFILIKIIIGVLFNIKSLDRFQDNVWFFIFRTYPEFETLSRFREKNPLSRF